MTRKRKRRKIKKSFLLIVLFLVIIIVSLVFFNIISNNDNDSIATSKVVDTISGYGYVTYDNDTKLFKDKYYELKEVLSHKDVDNLEYSKLVAELFIIDFFTLDNKISKNDVGGVQFVYSNYKSSFVDKARDEFYKYVDSNLNGDRSQKLPEVSDIRVDSCDSTSLKNILDSSLFGSVSEAYSIKLSWDYKEDLGYQDEAYVIVVQDEDNKFSVAKLYSE